MTSSPACWPPSFRWSPFCSGCRMPACEAEPCSSSITTATSWRIPTRRLSFPGRCQRKLSRSWPQIRALPKDLRNTETIRFTQKEKNHSVEMIGTY